MPPSAVPTFRCLLVSSRFVSLVPFYLTTSPRPAALSPSCGVLSKLRKMEPEASAPRYGQLLECVCGWGQAADVVELVTDWLAEALPKQGVSVAERQPAL